MFKNLFKKKNKQPQNPLAYLKKNYTNEIQIEDIDHKKITIKVRNVGNNKTFLILESDKASWTFDKDLTVFFSAILSDYIENGNINQIENVMEEVKKEEDQGE